MNPNIEKLLCEAVKENRDQKTCLIEDIFKVKRLLYGMGFDRHISAINDPVSLFDYLNDCTIERLELRLAVLSATASKKARELAGFADDEQTLKP
jgi:negative regulator of replication initiation